MAAACPWSRGSGSTPWRWPLVTVGAMAAGAALSAVLVHGFGSAGELGTILRMLLVALTMGVVLTRWVGVAERPPVAARSSSR